MTNLNEWFEKGLTPEAYKEQMESHKENMEKYTINFQFQLKTKRFSTS